MGFLKSIIAKIGWDLSEFEAGAKKAEGISHHLGEEMQQHFKSALAGAFGVAAFEEGIRSVVEYAAHIKDMAEQTGISTEEVQKLGYAAKSTGLQFEDFQTAISKLGGARKDAAEKNDALLIQFERFGVSLEDLQNPALRNIDLLYKMSAAIKDVELNAGDRSTLREFFGRSGDKLAESIAHIDQVKDRPIISQADIEAIDKMDKAIERLITALKVLASGPVGAVAKDVTAVINPDAGIAERISSYLKLTLNPTGGIAASLAQTIAARFRGPPSAQNPVATDTGQQFGPFQEGSEGKLFTDERDIELLKEEAEVRKILERNSFVALNHQQQKLQLQREINAMLASAQALQPSDPKLAADVLKQAAEKNNQLQELNLKGNLKPLNVDSLARIGGFVGGAETVMADLARRNLEANRQTSANTAAIAEALKHLHDGDNDR